VFNLADALGVDCRAFKDCVDVEEKPAAGEATPAAKKTTKKRKDSK
jgi:hypothetical protein